MSTHGHDLASAYARQYLEANKSKSEEDRLKDYAKLSGADFDVNKYADEHMNAKLGQSLGAQYKLAMGQSKGIGGGFMRPKVNMDQANALRSQMANQAYTDAINSNLFSQERVTDEAKLKELGDAGQNEKGGGANYWIKLHNNLTGEDSYDRDYDEKDESNYWRAHKRNIIMGGAGAVGFLLGGPALALTAASLAGAARDAYAARVERRKLQDAKRDWDNEQLAEAAANAPQYGNLFKSAGEGVVDWNTSDVDKNKRRDTYVRKAT